ncbi:MAG: hypothetical protein ABH830_02405 [Patescibacteria group bacterium]
MATIAVINHEGKYYPLIRMGEVKIPVGDKLIFELTIYEKNTPDMMEKLIDYAEDLARKKFKIKVEYLQ